MTKVTIDSDEWYPVYTAFLMRHVYPDSSVDPVSVEDAEEDADE